MAYRLQTRSTCHADKDTIRSENQSSVNQIAINTPLVLWNSGWIVQPSMAWNSFRARLKRRCGSFIYSNLHHATSPTQPLLSYSASTMILSGVTVTDATWFTLYRFFLFVPRLSTFQHLSLNVLNFHLLSLSLCLRVWFNRLCPRRALGWFVRQWQLTRTHFHRIMAHLVSAVQVCFSINSIFTPKNGNTESFEYADSFQFEQAAHLGRISLFEREHCDCLSVTGHRSPGTCREWIWQAGVRDRRIWPLGAKPAQVTCNWFFQVSRLQATFSKATVYSLITGCIAWSHDRGVWKPRL